jgi:hypothetical protein
MRNAAARLAVPAVVLSITVSLAWATRGSSERWYSSGIAAREIVERLVPVFESLPEGSYVYVDCKNCSIADIQDSRIFVVAAHVLAKRPDLVIERHPMNGETVTKNVAEERPDAVVLISLDNRARAFARTLTGSSVRHLRPAVKDSFRLDR